MDQQPEAPDLKPIENPWDGEDLTWRTDSPIINRDHCGKLIQRWTAPNHVSR